jgi:ubiquitin C-terminal hydrolase
MNNTLIEYKINYLLYPFGLYNNSIICYFNSLIQSLFSCTSITEYLLHNEKKFNNNNFIKLYIELLKKYINLENQSDYLLENGNLILFNEFLNIIKNKNIKFGYNQEDSSELLILLLDIIKDTYINSLFMHKYKCDIYCKYCKKLIEIKEDESIQFEMNITEINNNYLKYQIDKKLHNLNKYIRNNYSNLSDYKCKNCNNIDMIKINRLSLVPTIITIVLNKYQKKYEYEYPIELFFINNSINKCYKYKLISTINHSGTMNYGHYISKALRKNHKYNNNTDSLIEYYLLNDNSYEKTNMKSEINSYILFYHYIENIDYYD